MGLSRITVCDSNASVASQNEDIRPTARVKRCIKNKEGIKGGNIYGNR